MKDGLYLKIIVIGAGGHGKVCIDAINSMNKYQIVGFIDDNEKMIGTEVYNMSVLGTVQDLLSGLEDSPKGVFISIGENKVREKIFRQVENKFEIINAIHSKAVLSDSVEMGKGVLVVAGTIVNADSKIGDGAIINTGATVDHDNKIGKFAFIAPGAHLAGKVTVGDFSHIGIGASILQNISIGSNTTIGAGAVVVKDIPDNCVAYGIPAKIMKENKK